MAERVQIIRVRPFVSSMNELIMKLKENDECRSVELMYSSDPEFDLCVMWGKWLMDKYSPRALKVKIIP